MGALVIIKKGTGKHINKILRSPSLNKIQKILFVEVLITLGETVDGNEKYH